MNLAQANIFRVDAVPGEMVMKSAQYLIAEHGEQTDSLRAVFQAGVSCADFTGSVHFPESTLTTNEVIFNEKSDNLEEYYGRLTTAMFVTMDGQPLPACSSISLFDHVNERLLFLVVAYPGLNVVYYEDSLSFYSVSLVSPVEGSKESNRMEPNWTAGNNHDLVMMAQMFGFPYDKACDEVIIPPGRPQSSFMIGSKCAISTLAAIRSMIGGK